MPDPVETSRVITLVEHAADEAADLAERMKSIGAWGAYAALAQLTREREARAERLHSRWRAGVSSKVQVPRLVG